MEGGSRGGISFFKSYISLGVCARVQLNTFCILSITCEYMRGNCVELCGHTFSYLARRFNEIIWNNPIISGINWTHLKTSEFIWIYLKLSGINWIHLKTSEYIWTHLKLSEIIWNYLNISETILMIFWNYLKLSEKIRHCVKLGNSALHKIRQLHIKN